jgi:hypothetical protein
MFTLTGEIVGFVFDRGPVVRFPAVRAVGVTQILSIGSRVSVEGCMRVSHFGETYFDAVTIASLDSQRFIEFDGPPSPQSREVAPVAPSRTGDMAPPSRREQSDAAQIVAIPVADVTLQHAVNSLHHTEALLVYLVAVKTKGPRILHKIFFESVHAYEQALTRRDEGDIAEEEEFASASGFLSRAAEILILRALQLDNTYAVNESFAQDPVAEIKAVALAEDELKRVEALLSKIRMFVDDRVARALDGFQLKKLLLLGETLFGQARGLFLGGGITGAIQLAHAAEAVAHSAERLHRIESVR